MCTFSLLLLGFARAIAGTMIGSSHARDTVTIALVVLSIFAIDFSVNAVNALDRALLLDLVPIHQQSTANAWAARMSGIGAIFGFLIGQTDLTQLVPFRWFSVLQPDLVAGIDSTEAQIRCVSLLVSFLLVTTHLVTVAVAKETPLSKVETIEDVEQAKRSMLRRLVLYFVSMMRDLALAARQLPRPMLEIFRVQFFLSLGWYPTCESRCLASASLIVLLIGVPAHAFGSVLQHDLGQPDCRARLNHNGRRHCSTKGLVGHALPCHRLPRLHATTAVSTGAL